MTSEIHDRLDESFARHELVGQIHDVPPHEVYEVRIEGRRAIYKRNSHPRGTASVEGAVTAFVDEQTSVPVPEVLAIGEDDYVAAWHPDAPAPDEGQQPDDEWATATGRGLATLHKETAELVDEYGQFGAEDGTIRLQGHSKWHDASVDYVEHHRPVLREYGHEDIVDDVRSFLRANPDVFSGSGDPVCCHGWATPEHVATNDGDVVCLVDFEHAIAAPGEFDYWRTVAPTFGADDETARQAFREGYEAVRELPDGFESRQRLYALLNLVYYFESLYVQDQHDPEQTATKAENMRAAVTDLLETFQS